MKKKLVSIIIVNWNGKKYLENCLASIKKQHYKNIEIILVDNASTDESISFVKKNYPDIILIQNSQNDGFAKGNNIGYNHVHGEYVLFLNNDTQVLPNFIVELVKTIESNLSIGGAQGKILLMEKKDTLDSVGAFLTFTGFLYHYGFGKKDSKKYSKQIDLYSAKGACMLFRRSVLEKIKIYGELFDSRFFAYFEETDLCHRIWLAGYKIVYVPKSIIYHKMGATSSKLNSEFVQYHSFKNRINSYLKNLSLSQALIILPIHITLVGLVSVIFLLQGKIALFWALQKAIIWNIVTINDTLKLRKKVQKIRRKSDSAIFKKIMKNPKLGYYFHLFSDISLFPDPDFI